MKKLLAIFVAVMLCASLALPVAAANTEFTPSVENKPAPEIVPVIDPDGNPALAMILNGDGEIIDYVYEDCLIITAVAEAPTSTEIPNASRDLLLDVYGKLTSGDMALPYEKFDSKLNAGNMVIRDLFDATFLCSEHPEMLEPEGVILRIKFKLNVAADTNVYTMTYNNDAWSPIKSTVNNGDGTVTCDFEHLCPVAFSLETGAKPPVQTGDDMGDVLIICSIVAGVSMLAVIALSVAYFRGNSKKS